MTLIIGILMLFYTSIKFVHLMSRHNPSISSHKQLFYYDSSEVVNLKESGVRMAFSVEGFLDGEIKDDPRYVKYLVRLWGKKDGVKYERILDYHKCTPGELDLFGEPSRESIAPLQTFKFSEKRHLYCLDWENLDEDEVGVWGVTNDENYQRWEFVLVPCNYIHREFGDIGDSIHEECEANLQKQMDYLGNMKVSMYVTDASFNREEYGDHSIKQQAKFFTM